MAVNNKYTYICKICNTENKANQPTTKLCSSNCRTKYYNLRFNKEFSISKDISPGTAGAITELKISTWLMEKGYAVFRALSPSCFCDLIAIKNKDVMYIEARTGYVALNGNLCFSKKISTKNGKLTHFIVYIRNNNEIRLIKI